MIHDQKVIVIIPAFNEELSIGSVIRDIPSIVDHIIVVDNNSTDATAVTAAKNGAIVVSERKRGYGAACLAGIAAASLYEPDIIVFMDGDYSDYPEEIMKLLHPILHENCEFVIGSRTLGIHQKGALLPQARIGNFIACTLIRIFWGMRFTDLGPFRAIRYTSLLHLSMQDLTWGWTVEMQIKAAKKKYGCTEVPVQYRKRIGTSKITGTLSGSIKAGYKILSTIIYHAIAT